MGNCFCSSGKKVSKETTTSVPSSAKESSSSTTTGKLSTFSSITFEQSTGSGASNDDTFPDGRILEMSNLRIFSFAELRSVTKNFKPETLIGEGGFGKVFKGWVDEKTLAPAKSGLGMIVAVKKLKSESMQGLEEWQSEVKFLGGLSHPNLVKLLGYCWEDRELLLVYEFMPKGSLENHLFRRGPSFEPLTWNLRIKIAIGAARGLAFLHSLKKQVIYRDFKSSNILLDLNYNAKLSDFGLAKNGPTDDNSHVTTRIMGTYGYAAPEYVATGHLYVKSDVYGFGVVLLELLSGLRALDKNRPAERQKLADWAQPFLSDRKRLARLMDSRLGGQYPSKGAFRAAQLALRCLSREPKRRPPMKEVLEVLEGIEANEPVVRGGEGRLVSAQRSQPWKSSGVPSNAGKARPEGSGAGAKAISHSLKARWSSDS